MATIDYKQKIKDYMNSSEVDTLYKSMLNNLFPELAVSEDERIRKAIINIIGDIDGGFKEGNIYNIVVTIQSPEEIHATATLDNWTPVAAPVELDAN